ncbi:AAA family ATPase [Levilactobacillus brevis]|uniref:AAA family ATPase n=1 Tax=Levilactobacillus brevis TaxID=1580 RepID=UPI0021A548E2|nr:ATP-dependent Clp protease ATP-binding subunit [Levilactobacillus brevis]MCT3582421.1 ATP-dependent Clp protease ATP-binding subunit [Levilactobacillus brevis]
MTESLLKKYCLNLNYKVNNDLGNYNTIGREADMERLIAILSNKRKHHPLIIGEPGVGKTDLIEGFVKKIVLGEVPATMQNKTVWVLELARLMKQKDMPFIGLFESLIDELKQDHPDDYLFIDEIHTVMGAGSHQGNSLDAGNVLKPALARGEINLIGATTVEEYGDNIEPDGALMRRFSLLMLAEPTLPETLEILEGLKSQYEEFHHVKIAKDALPYMVTFSHRYMPDRFMPDKAIDLMDDACSFANLKDQEEVTRETVAQVLDSLLGIPIHSILKDDQQRVTAVSQVLKSRIMGQDKAISEVIDAVSIGFTGLADPNKPISSFLFLGTPGTGKTETAKGLAQALFDSEDAMIRLDMSEYQEPQSAQRLIGTKGRRGILTEAVKHKQYAVLLLDEIEKGDQSVQDLFLQILQDGIVHDSYGRAVSFKNTIIVMTTNLAGDLIDDATNYSTTGQGETIDDQIAAFNDSAQQLTNGQNIRVGSGKDADRMALDFNNKLQMELTDYFRPEFVNRIEHKVIFNMLSKPVVHQIAKLNLMRVNKRLQKAEHLEFMYDQRLIKFISDEGFDLSNGARPIAYMTNRKVMAPLARMLIQMKTNGRPSGLRGIRAIVRGHDPIPGEDRFGNRRIEFEAIN